MIYILAIKQDWKESITGEEIEEVNEISYWYFYLFFINSAELHLIKLMQLISILKMYQYSENFTLFP